MPLLCKLGLSLDTDAWLTSLHNPVQLPWLDSLSSNDLNEWGSPQTFPGESMSSKPTVWTPGAHVTFWEIELILLFFGGRGRGGQYLCDWIMELQPRDTLFSLALRLETWATLLRSKENQSKQWKCLMQISKLGPLPLLFFLMLS